MLIKTIIYTASIFFVALLLLVFFAPLPFTACSPHSFWCSTAYGLTTSGGPIGFLVLLILTCLCYASSANSKTAKLIVFFRSLVFLSLFFGLLAVVNEHYTKTMMKSQRPSHVFMLKQTGLAGAIDSLYALDKTARKEFFRMLVKTHPEAFKEIDPEVQQHWIQEAGYSFPSGHTFNAFLFAMILAYAIYFNRSYPSLRVLYAIPFAWALLVGISRVAIGAHTAYDVCAGALLGIGIGMLFLSIDRTRYWLTQKG